MDQKYPATQLPNVHPPFNGWLKGLISVVVLVLVGCGDSQSQVVSAPPTDTATARDLKTGDSVQVAPRGGPREKSEEAGSAVIDSEPGTPITNGKVGAKRPNPGGRNPNTQPQPPPGLSKTAISTRIPKVTLLDQQGKPIYTGPIDLQSTLDRIKSGKRTQHRNDGTVFQNREGRLPRKRAGYYHEYVVPTPRESGPGPQRLIVGSEGEIYYTSDHYKSFRPVNTKDANTKK